MINRILLFLVFFIGSLLSIQAHEKIFDDICIRENGTFYFLHSKDERMKCKKNETRFLFSSLISSGSGTAGPKGETGATGATGPTGATGAIGPEGPMGPPGMRGEQGFPGEKGEKGDEGIPGINGTSGPMGPEGPQGEAGEKGEAGPEGLPGKDGRDGVSGYEIIFSEISPDDEHQKTVIAQCPETKVVIGGGFLTLNVSNSNEIVITRNYPSNTHTWEVKGGIDGASASDESFSLQAYAICVNIS